MKAVCIGYEPVHAPLLEQQYKRHDHNITIVTFDLELEWELTAKGIPFTSLRRYSHGDHAHNLEQAERITTHIRSRYISRISYRDVALDMVFGFSLQTFIQRWLYYAEVASMFIEQEKPIKVFICAPRYSADVARNAMLHYNNEAAVLCIEAFCNEHSVPYEVIGSSARSLFVGKSFRNYFLEAVLSLLNAVMGLLQKKSNIRILATEYWSHIDKVFTELPHSSLVLYDRKEIKNIPLKATFAHRIRFMHGPDRLSSVAMRRIHSGMQQISLIWNTQKEKLNSEPLLFYGQNFSRVLVPMLHDVITYQAQTVLTEIEKTYALLQDVRPHVILLRAVVSAQPHFPILSQVARALSIPALELQHGLEIFAPGSISRLHEVEHMAVYGEVIRQEMERYASGPEFSVVGSIGFDGLYSRKERQKKELSRDIVCVTPDMTFTAAYDTYDVYNYFQAVGEAAKANNMIVRIKLRSTSDPRQSFYREAAKRACAGVPITFIEGGTILAAGEGAYLGVSCFSTAALELLRSGVPTILLGLSSAEGKFISFHFSQYEQQGAVQIARTTEELISISTVLRENPKSRNALAEAGIKFMEENYAFDGLAEQRLARLIQKLACRGKS